MTFALLLLNCLVAKPPNRVPSQCTPEPIRICTSFSQHGQPRLHPPSPLYISASRYQDLHGKGNKDLVCIDILLGAWDPLFDVARANPSVPFEVVINPNSGPNGPCPNSDFINATSILRQIPNVKLLGYVHVCCLSYLVISLIPCAPYAIFQFLTNRISRNPSESPARHCPKTWL